MRQLAVDNVLSRLSQPLLPVDGFKRPPSGALLHLGTYPQVQKNQFYVAAIAPLGRLDSTMLKGAAQLASDYGDGTLRFTPWQGVLLPYVEKPHAVTERLMQLGFVCSIDQPLARMTACTGSSGCAKAKQPATDGAHQKARRKHTGRIQQLHRRVIRGAQKKDFCDCRCILRQSGRMVRLLRLRLLCDLLRPCFLPL